MARPKKTDTAPQNLEGPEIVPNGAHFGLMQLPQDMLPPPSAQRLVQWVNRNGKLSVYVSENGYVRIEAITWMDKLLRLSYQASISKGGAALAPVKGRIHWVRFTEEFLKTLKGERINPETDLAEIEA